MESERKWNAGIDTRTLVLYNQTMELWDRFLALFRMLRGNGLRRYELNESLQAALEERANREKRPVDELQQQALSTGLAEMEKSEGLKQRWESLTRRERDMVALTCLGYNNFQMAGRLSVSPETVKTHLSNAMRKFGLHRKGELRLTLSDWDFREWGPPL